MLDKTTKKEIKQLCDDATLEGLLKILSNEDVKANQDVFEFIELEYNTRKERLIKKLPNYIKNQNYNINRLVYYICKGSCKIPRWLELQQEVLKKSDLKDTQPGDYTAKCLKCGTISQACYNFSCP
mgnify:CR=1 FL=1